MIVMMRDDFRARAHALAPEVGSGVQNMAPLTRYKVIFMWCGPQSNVAFLDWGGPFPDGVDLRLCEIVDHSIDAAWRVGRYRYDNDLEVMLLGPEFWATDYHWYERLLDGDEKAKGQYRDYVSSVLIP